MGIRGKRTNYYRETDDILHVERQKALMRQDWEAYDMYDKKIKENMDAWQANKSINEKFDKGGRANIVVKVLALLGIGGGIAYMAHSEKTNGVVMSGTNGEVKKGFLQTVIGWLH